MIQERGWQIFATYRDEIAARVDVLVPAELMHRARWLWSQADFTDGELRYLATGELAGSDQ